MISLTTTQLRNLMQLPERPYSDVRYFDGTKYYDLEKYEVCSVFTCSGTVSGSAHLFNLGTDFQITAGSVDWSIGSIKPDINTAFTIDYTYSKLGALTASTAVQNAVIMASYDLGSKYPYASTTVVSTSTDAIATMIAAFAAAKEACLSLSGSEIDVAQKIRRGSIQFDDSKKTTDWIEEERKWDAKYKRYLILARGMVRGFRVINTSNDNLLFGALGREVFDNLSILGGSGCYEGYSDGNGIF